MCECAHIWVSSASRVCVQDSVSRQNAFSLVSAVTQKSITQPTPFEVVLKSRHYVCNQPEYTNTHTQTPRHTNTHPASCQPQNQFRIVAGCVVVVVASTFPAAASSSRQQQIQHKQSINTHAAYQHHSVTARAYSTASSGPARSSPLLLRINISPNPLPTPHTNLRGCVTRSSRSRASVWHTSVSARTRPPPNRRTCARHREVSCLYSRALSTPPVDNSLERETHSKWRSLERVACRAAPNDDRAASASSRAPVLIVSFVPCPSAPRHTGTHSSVLAHPRLCEWHRRESVGNGVEWNRVRWRVDTDDDDAVSCCRTTTTASVDVDGPLQEHRVLCKRASRSS